MRSCSIWCEPISTWFEIHAYPSEIGLGLYFRDINARKRDDAAQVKAARGKERFFDRALDLLVVANFDGHFMRLNPSWEQTLGFTAAELIAQPYLDLVHPDDLAATLATANRLSQGQMLIGFENRYRCKDGSYRWLSWSSRPDPNLRLVYAVAHDITERKLAQAELEQRNQELDSFVYIVSHDLKAPLRGIANLSEWIEEDLEGSLSVTNQEQMLLLRSRVYKMEAMIDGLLDYARCGRSDRVIESVSIAELLGDLIDEIAPPPTFTIELPPEAHTIYSAATFIPGIRKSRR
jgi:PAS domain S-box-containing protein